MRKKADRCKCKLCRTTREISRIAKLLPEHDANILIRLYNIMFDRESELEMENAWLKDKGKR